MKIIPRVIYSLFGLLLSPFILLLFAFHPRGRRRLRDRLGLWGLPKSTSYIWIHGASVGELRGLMPLIPNLKEKYPEAKLLFTSFSVTGIETLGEHADESRVLPFDSFPFVQLALSGVSLDCFIFGETEIWPELFTTLGMKNVPMILANGRVEEKSIQFYKLFSFFISDALRLLRVCCVASELHKQRLVHLGYPESEIHVTGNTKYDRKPSFSDESQIQHFKDSLGLSGRLIITLGSLHPGEEKYWLEPLMKLRKEHPEIFFVVAPRHLEKIGIFESSLDASNVSYLMRSQINSGSQDLGALLVDTFGDLEKFYAISDLAFVGGTLVPIGGHNPLEPALYGVPVVLGPERSQIPNEVEALKNQDALLEVQSRKDVEELLAQFVDTRSDIVEKGRAAQKVALELSGATQRVERVLSRTLSDLVKNAGDSYAIAAQ